MAESLEIEHQRRLRAERVQALLLQLWGEGLPPGPAGALTLLIDAVGIDDFHAAEDQLISQGDGVSYQLLAALWQHYRAVTPTEATPTRPGPGLQLPEGVLERLKSLQLIPSTFIQAMARQLAPQLTPPLTPPLTPSPDPARASTAGSPPVTHAGDAALPAFHSRIDLSPAGADLGDFARVGVWEIDPRTDIVAFDAVAAQLLGDGDVAGYSTVTRHLQELIHPDDHVAITAALQEVVTTQAGYRVRFRVHSPTGAVTHLISQGRMLHTPGEQSARLTGYLTIDDDSGRGPLSEGDPQPRTTTSARHLR